MNKFFTLLTALVVTAGAANAQLLSQNFNSSSTLTDFVDAATPGTTKFNALGTSGAGTVVSINSSKLRYARTGNAGSMCRTTDFTALPGAVKVRFEFTMTGNSAATSTAIVFQLGDGFGTANSVEANASVHSRFAINTTVVAGEFQFRDQTNSVNSSNLSGTQNVTWVVNNSGGSKNYFAPDGTTEAVANDTYDLWAGTTRIFNDVAAQTAAKTLADFKMAFSAGVATIDLDNIEVYEIDDILPISLVKFSADKLSEKVKISWTTATEINNDMFMVQRSSDGENFETIAEVRGAGNSREINNYSIIDAEPLKGTSYYRLRQYDFDGKSETFAPVAVRMDAGSLKLEAVSSKLEAGSIDMNIYSPVATATSIRVMDLSGRIIASENINLVEGYQTVNINANALSSGIHIIQLMSGEEVVMKKLVL